MVRKYKQEYLTNYYDVPNSEEQRRIRVVLPRSYNKTDKRYPVVYFNDGQNMLNSNESFSGSSWELFRCMRELEKDFEFIAVCIDNAGDRRLSEYSPWYSDTNIHKGEEILGEGDDYLDFIVQILKPDIDNSFRTLANRKNTAIIGSSMGGLISAYAGFRYNNVFGRIGVFSLCVWYARQEFIDAGLFHPLDSDTKIYIQSGTEEGGRTSEKKITSRRYLSIEENISQAYIDDAIMYMRVLAEKGIALDYIDLNINHMEYHSEIFWAKHLNKCISFLFNND